MSASFIFRLSQFWWKVGGKKSTLSFESVSTFNVLNLVRIAERWPKWCIKWQFNWPLILSNEGMWAIWCIRADFSQGHTRTNSNLAPPKKFKLQKLSIRVNRHIKKANNIWFKAFQIVNSNSISIAVNIQQTTNWNLHIT